MALSTRVCVCVCVCVCCVRAQIVQLFSDLSELATDIREMYKKHLSIFNLKQENDVRKLEDNLV